jgi:CxxC motif-containing protein (DUF1111 family)
MTGPNLHFPRLACIGLVILTTTAMSRTSATPGGADSRTEPEPAARTAGDTQLGERLFRKNWTALTEPNSTDRRRVGPLFNAASCQICHNDGLGGHALPDSGPAPVALVIQLESRLRHAGADTEGDPVYGRVLNTQASPGAVPEGRVVVRYVERYGYYYPDGTRWRIRVPHYSIEGPSLGPLAPTTVIKPRLAPSLLGSTLLESVPESAIDGSAHAGAGIPAWDWINGKRVLGRFGWQGASTSVRVQTTTAFAREMGITSADHPADDRTPAERGYSKRPSPESADVLDEEVSALVAFQRTLVVPESPPGNANTAGPRLFSELGCSACHLDSLPTASGGSIHPYTDLRTHNLGVEMADEDVTGKKVVSRWRTAPLWALGYRRRENTHFGLLHDGRARTAEEAILWHGGEAAVARRRFAELGPRSRSLLLSWLDSL